MSDDRNALERERAGYVMRGLPDRVAAVDAVLARLDAEEAAAEPVVEAAVADDPVPAADDDAPVIEAAVQRGPGRPRKPKG